MGFSPEMCRRGRNDRRLKSFEPKPRFRDSCHNGVFGARRSLDCRNPCDRMIRRPTKKRRGRCNCPSPCTKWDVTIFFRIFFWVRKMSLSSPPEISGLVPCTTVFSMKHRHSPLKLRIPGGGMGWVKWKNTNKNGNNTFKMWYLHKQIF